MLSFRFEPMRSLTIEDFYLIKNRLVIGNHLNVEVRWFDHAHVGLTQSWVVRDTLKSTRNCFWWAMIEPRSGSNQFRIRFDEGPLGFGLGLKNRL